MSRFSLSLEKNIFLAREKVFPSIGTKSLSFLGLEKSFTKGVVLHLVLEPTIAKNC